MNTKVEDNFVAHNLDTEFALFGVRTWEIWRLQGRTANRKIWLILWKPSLFLSKEDLVQGKVEHAQRHSKDINTTP
jgi:hypothetical protein